MAPVASILMEADQFKSFPLTQALRPKTELIEAVIKIAPEAELPQLNRLLTSAKSQQVSSASKMDNDRDHAEVFASNYIGQKELPPPNAPAHDPMGGGIPHPQQQAQRQPPSAQQNPIHHQQCGESSGKQRRVIQTEEEEEDDHDETAPPSPRDDDVEVEIQQTQDDYQGPSYDHGWQAYTTWVLSERARLHSIHSDGYTGEHRGGRYGDIRFYLDKINTLAQRLMKPSATDNVRDQCRARITWIQRLIKLEEEAAARETEIVAYKQQLEDLESKQQEGGQPNQVGTAEAAAVGLKAELETTKTQLAAVEKELETAKQHLETEKNARIAAESHASQVSNQKTTLEMRIEKMEATVSTPQSLNDDPIEPQRRLINGTMQLAEKKEELKQALGANKLYNEVVGENLTLKQQLKKLTQQVTGVLCSSSFVHAIAQ